MIRASTGLSAGLLICAALAHRAAARQPGEISYHGESRRLGTAPTIQVEA